MIERLDILESSRLTKGLIVFLLALAALTALSSWLLIELNNHQRYYITLFMLGPGIAAYLAARSIGVGVESLGLRLAPLKDNLTAYFLPFAYGLIAYGAIWLFFSDGYGSQEAAKKIGRWLGMADSERSQIFGAFTALMATVGFVLQLAPHATAEIGLRGFLATALKGRTGFLWAALASALVYTAMHVPLFFMTDYNAGPQDKYLQLLFYFLTAASMAVIALYYRFKTGSIIPGTILQSSHTAFVLFGLGEPTSKSDITWRYAGEFGLMIPAVMLPIAFYYWRKAKAAGL